MTRLLILALCLLPAVGQAQSYNSLTAASDIHAKLQDNAASTAIVNPNGSAGALLGAGNTSASTTTGPVAWLPAALSLDGTDDRIEFDKPAGWTAYPFSFGVWCRINAASGEQVAASLHVDGASSQYMALYAISGVSGSKPAIVARNTTEVKSSGPTNTTTAWTFVSGTFHSATDRRLFINGALAATGTTSVAFPSANKLTIGRLRNSGSALSLGGAVAEVIGDGVAWADSDHAQLYAGPEPSLTSGGIFASQSGLADDTTVFDDATLVNGSISKAWMWQHDDGGWDDVGETDPDVGPEEWGTAVDGRSYRLSMTPSNAGGAGNTIYSNEFEYEAASSGAAYLYYQQLLDQ
jgi:hypothetical protein